jgi:hypothetical protein
MEWELMMTNNDDIDNTDSYDITNNENRSNNS